MAVVDSRNMLSLCAKKKRFLRSLITKHELQAAEDAIVAAAAECCPLVLGRRENYSARGNSRYGGVPDLPASIPWPRSDNGYLTFLMQIDLGEVPSIAKNPLPKTGFLYFFIESDDCASDVRARVRFFRGRRSLLKKTVAPPAEELAHEYYRNLVPHKITIAAGVDIPTYGSTLFDYVQQSAERNQQGDGGDRLLNLKDDALGLRTNQRQAGQLLGCSSQAHGGMRENAHLTSIGKRDRIYDYTYRKRNQRELRSGAEDWRFLWRIDSEFAVGVCIHDAGEFYILIRKPDLSKRDFSRIYVEIEGG